MSFENDMLPGVTYQGVADDGIGPSDKIWGRFKDVWGTRNARCFERDFTTEPLTLASATSQNGIISYQDASCTVAGDATLDDGILLSVAGVDNNEISIGGDTQAIGTISDAAGEAKLLAFEASIKKSSIADNALALFIGLMEPGKVAANALVDNTGAVVDADYIGFSNLCDDGDSLDAVYKKAGQTAQDVEAGCHTLAADTFVKLGLVYDPSAKAENKVTFFVDGVDIGSYVTATNIAAATFPDSEDLNWIFAVKVGAAAAANANLRWVRFAQLR